jgi:hypothetical protein
MLRGENNVPLAGVFGQLDPGVGVETDGIKLWGESCVILFGIARLPLGGRSHEGPGVFPTRQGANSPMDEETELPIIELFKPGVGSSYSQNGEDKQKDKGF